MMSIDRFLKVLGIQQPLICIQGDIFITPADHIAFAVNFPNKDGEWNNGQGFASLVEERGWEGLSEIKFEKGKTISKKIFGKTYHAMPVHSNESGGWDDAPELIENCLNLLPADSTEVISTILIGGGGAGKKFKANVNNVAAMSRSFKTVVLYIKEQEIYGLLVRYGIVSASMPLASVPKTKKLGLRTESITA